MFNEPSQGRIVTMKCQSQNWTVKTLSNELCDSYWCSIELVIARVTEKGVTACAISANEHTMWMTFLAHLKRV